MQSLPDVLKHLFHPRRSNNHRPRILHPEGFLVVAIVTIGLFAGVKAFKSFPGMGGVLGFASNISVDQVVALTNQERAKQGLPALSYNSQLSQAAAAKAQDMFADQYWAHTAPDGTEPWAFISGAGYRYQVAGENLARDFGDTGSMVAAWMASPTHRANIVSSRYREIGIAVVNGVLQGTETTLVVQMFGTPASAVAAVDAPTQPTTQTVQTNSSPQPAVASPTPEVESTQPEESVTEPAVLAQPPASPVSQVLASVLVPLGSIERPPLFTPLQITKAFFLAVILMIVLTLLYDSAVIGHRRTTRIVGNNLSHLLLLLTVAYLLILFKGGVIG